MDGCALNPLNYVFNPLNYVINLTSIFSLSACSHSSFILFLTFQVTRKKITLFISKKPRNRKEKKNTQTVIFQVINICPNYNPKPLIVISLIYFSSHIETDIVSFHQKREKEIWIMSWLNLSSFVISSWIFFLPLNRINFDGSVSQKVVKAYLRDINYLEMSKMHS